MSILATMTRGEISSVNLEEKKRGIRIEKPQKSFVPVQKPKTQLKMNALGKKFTWLLALSGIFALLTVLLALIATIF